MRFLAQKLSTVPGVSEARIFGQQTYAAHVQINPGSLASRGLGLEDVRNALVATTLDRPKGALEGAHQTYTLDANDQLFNAAAYDNVIIAYRNGAPVRVKDVGRAINSTQYNRSGSWFFDTKAEGLAIQRQAGANTIQLVDTIKAMVPKIIEFVSAFDQSGFGLGPIAGDPRRRARRPVYDDDDDRAGDPGHLFILAHLVGDDHS